MLEIINLMDEWYLKGEKGGNSCQQVMKSILSKLICIPELKTHRLDMKSALMAGI